MAGKRRNTPARATGRTDRLSAPIDFKGRPPMICTLGSDLRESQRLQVALYVLQGRACWLNADRMDVSPTVDALTPGA